MTKHHIDILSFLLVFIIIYKKRFSRRGVLLHVPKILTLNFI